MEASSAFSSGLSLPPLGLTAKGRLSLFCSTVAKVFDLVEP
jgi:hypothetical protein